MTAPDFGPLQPAADEIAALMTTPARRSNRAKRKAADRFVAEYAEHQAAAVAEQNRQARGRQFWAEQGRTAARRAVTAASWAPGNGDKP